MGRHVRRPFPAVPGLALAASAVPTVVVLHAHWLALVSRLARDTSMMASRGRIGCGTFSSKALASAHKSPACDLTPGCLAGSDGAQSYDQ